MAEIDTVGSPALWIGFGLFVALMLALDLGVFHRKAHVVSAKEATLWTVVWVALALAFNVFVFWQWGAETGESFLTGYLIEKALSVDNLFVFYMIFTAFAVPAVYQHKLLFWGIAGALVMRGAMVWGGIALLTRFHWVVYLFGVVLIATGVKMLSRRDDAPDPTQGRIFRAIRRVVPTTENMHGARLFAKEGGSWFATPLFLVLMLIELTDVIFAVDSILAIFAITEDPFIVFTSNIFAVMGLRSLYFLLAHMAHRFVYLQPGLAFVMIFVGIKMAVADWYKVPIIVSLGVVSLLLGGSIVASLVKSARHGDRSARKGDRAVVDRSRRAAQR